MDRRQLIKAGLALPLAGVGARAAPAKTPIYIGDMHYHLFFQGRAPAASNPLARNMAEGNATLVAWSLVGDLQQAGRLGVIVSPELTVEEAYLLCTLAQQIDPDALLAVGPIPIIGQDETYPNGFTIRDLGIPAASRAVNSLLRRNHVTANIAAISAKRPLIRSKNQGKRAP